MLKRTAALAFMLAATHALACPAAGKGWKDFSSFTIAWNGQAPMTMARLTDGLRVSAELQGRHQELLQLDGGPTLYLGHDPAKGPSLFAFLDIPVGMVLKPLAQQYASPCDLPGTPQPFTQAGTEAGDPGEVRGSARWLADGALGFDLEVVRRSTDAPPMRARGEIRFDERRPAPPDMPLTGWIATRGDPFKPEILPPAATLRELRELWERPAQPR
jgi:hypothetical protein